MNDVAAILFSATESVASGATMALVAIAVGAMLEVGRAVVRGRVSVAAPRVPLTLDRFERMAERRQHHIVHAQMEEIRRAAAPDAAPADPTEWIARRIAMLHNVGLDVPSGAPELARDIDEEIARLRLRSLETRRAEGEA